MDRLSCVLSMALPSFILHRAPLKKSISLVKGGWAVGLVQSFKACQILPPLPHVKILLCKQLKNSQEVCDFCLIIAARPVRTINQCPYPLCLTETVTHVLCLWQGISIPRISSENMKGSYFCNIYLKHHWINWRKLNMSEETEEMKLPLKINQNAIKNLVRQEKFSSSAIFKQMKWISNSDVF